MPAAGRYSCSLFVFILVQRLCRLSPRAGYGGNYEVIDGSAKIVR
jgi:hypothetical protein